VLKLINRWIKRVGIGLFVCIGTVLVVIAILMVMAARFNGIWKMDAHGLCLKADFGIVKAYAVTESSYTTLKNYDGVIINGTLYSGIGKFELNRSENTLELIDHGARYVYSADKQSKDYFNHLHKVVQGDQDGKLHMFYEILKENYAFADLYGVDFSQEYNKYAPLVTNETTNETLFEYMCRMVEKLDDGHVELYWRDKAYTPSDYKPLWFTDHAQELVNLIKENYLNDYHRFEDCYIRYGSLREDIGYIVFQAIGMPELNKSATTKKAMEKIMKEFADKRTIVIDMRFCNGGYDEAALLIAGYFANKEYPAYAKQAYNNGIFTPLQRVSVYPNTLNCNGNVIIITSGYTISAGEIFIRSMLANPEHNVTVIGEATAGYYSDAIPMILPDGFEYSLSTERYFWYDSTMIEGKGIEPNVEISFDLQAVKLGKDKALDWILQNQ
jgi:carboxyl-terminal processing protease